MIKINGAVVEVNQFPDGTPRINLDVERIEEATYKGTRCLWIDWFYEGNEELFYLMLVKRHLDRYFMNVDFNLRMPYIPNARMDRIKNEDEVFTLKYFCEFINSLNFTSVFVLDSHSDVSAALLNRCVNDNPKAYIQKAIEEISGDIILYFPDAGAAKRYADLFPELMYCYGEKKRDWKTGKILGLEIRKNGIELSGKTILMIDDIISYGGSLYYSANALKEEGVSKIYAYATHTEDSILDKEKGTFIKSLENHRVERLFTTNSLFHGNHDQITVMEV
ncbi:MAG: ribose-phosphate pyrophosphokinase [Lachnospiraceae bacterium]